MRETEFHDWLRKNIPEAKGAIEGIGDDAAILDAGDVIAAATDMLVEGVHYRAGEVSAEEIGAKAVNRNFSDMAAMGLSPTWILASAALPEKTPESFVYGLVKGMVEAAARFDASLVGGDTSRTLGGLVLDVTVLAKVQDLKPVRRSGALSGHRIMVTGDLGGSSLGKHMHFTPRVKEGLFLNRCHRPSAMIDISDGLALDLSRLLDASGIGAVLEADRIPLSKAAREMAGRSGREPLAHALGDGEDFELLFTLTAEEAESLLNNKDRFFEATDVGEILDDPGQRILKIQGKEQALEREGYDHII
ncbi:MAG: thiamine-phosphate kinase [Planctomycetota bacterium]|jgi:thiamine-monophosphate kinase